MSDSPEPATRTRIRTGELISFVSALLLVPIMFLLDWYGVVGLPLRARRAGLTTAENAWHVLTELTVADAQRQFSRLSGTVVLHVSQRSHGTKTDTSLIMSALGTVTAVPVAYRVLIDLPDSSAVVDVKLGGYLGLAAVIAVAIGGFESMRDFRERRGGLVPRSRKKASVASSPEAR